MAWDDETVSADVAKAGLHISECIGKDVAGQPDLEEALEAARYSSHPYSSLPKEWPPFAEVAESRELPSVLIERYNTAGGDGTALCGIFPEIRRAWASVDNSLFLWRFDKWDGQCPNYSINSSGELAICAVSLAKSKPGIFVEAIQYLLVLATPVELILVGVCCTGSGDGTDPYAEISLQPLPEYTLSSDGVIITCITCTDNGHIFLAGRDGHIYELQYTTGSGWRNRCRKVCLTTGLGSLVSRWILPNAFKFGAADPIVEMVVDNERHILYTRTEGMKLQVFDLGVDGDGPLKRIAEEKNLIDPRDSQYGGRRSSVSRAISRAAKPSIVCITPLSTMESKWLHILAVLSDGRRLYLSTSSSIGNNASHRPSSLKIVATRPSPPLGVGGGFTFGAMTVATRTQPEDLAMKVETAFYSSATLVISDSSGPAMSSLLVVSRDSTMQSSLSGPFGTATRSSRALRELVSSLPIEGRMLCAADVLPLPDIADVVQSLYSDAVSFAGARESCEQASAKLWAKGDLQTQHILPRRRIVIFGTMGVTEVIFNRPVDILRKLFESNAPRSNIEDFFNRFGAGEAAAMCLMLAAKIVFADENLISNSVAEKAAETFEDPGLVGMPQLDGSTAMSSARTPSGGFSMGQVVQEPEPVFSGAHEGLRLCSARLLFPLWELPVLMVREEGVVVCRLSSRAMQVLESKIRSLEQFLRSRRNKRRGLYGYVAGQGDLTGNILYGNGLERGADGRIIGTNSFGPYARIASQRDGVVSGKRQRPLYTSAELAAMEVRAMECLRRLLRRSSEALFLLKLISNHHTTRLVQGLDGNLRQKLVQLTFNRLVCSEEGDQLATRLISGLMEYYIGPEGRVTVDEISAKLREGCPSYFDESNYKYFLAVECLKKASLTDNAEERESLARDAFNHLSKVPESADLAAVCKRFEDIRFYEAVVRLPLQKVQALDSKGDAINGNHNVAEREQCFEIVMNALRSLKGEGRQRGTSTESILDPASRNRYIRQIIQLSVQWPDTTFHEYLYRTLIDIGLDNELLEYGGSDLVSFLQSAGRKPPQEVQTVGTVTSVIPQMRNLEASIPSSQTKYLDLLARYYILKRQHFLAAHVLYRLAERQCIDGEEASTLEQRCNYLSSAVLQAKSSTSNVGPVSFTRSNVDDGLLDMLEAKLAVLRFQMKIKEELDKIAAVIDARTHDNESMTDDPSSQNDPLANAATVRAAKDKAKELSLELKSITQLYNEYALPFELWEVCLEMLYFASYSGDADTKIVRETWARLLEQALSRGGVAEACSVLKRVGSNLYTGDGTCLPLDTLCLHLEKAALERSSSGVELVGDEDVARALLAACRGAPEPILSVYDQLLSNGAILPSPNLRLRLLRSVLVILREWSMSVLAQRMGTTTAGASVIFGRQLAVEQAAVINQGTRDKIINVANRYVTEVRRLTLPQSETEAVYRGFRELEEKLLAPTSYRPF